MEKTSEPKWPMFCQCGLDWHNCEEHYKTNHMIEACKLAYEESKKQELVEDLTGFKFMGYDPMELISIINYAKEFGWDYKETKGTKREAKVEEIEKIIVAWVHENERLRADFSKTLFKLSTAICQYVNGGER